MWKSRHNFFQDTVGGCRTKIVLENRQGEICLLIAAGFDHPDERVSEIRRARRRRPAEQAPSPKSEFRPILREPRQPLADGEFRVFRKHGFQSLDFKRHYFDLFFATALRLPRKPRCHHLVESLLFSFSDTDKRQPGGFLIRPLHISPIDRQRPLQAGHRYSQF